MTTARGLYFSTHQSGMFTEPISALTGRPSAPLIESGSAKKPRYRSPGVSHNRSGAGTARSMVLAHADDQWTRRAQGRRGRDARDLRMARADPEGRRHLR